MDMDDKSLGFQDATGVSSGFDPTESGSGSQSSDKRDEIQEIRNQSRTEDRRVDLWRWTLLFLIMAVGIVITALTYYFLQQEEQKALNIAYDQFSEALSDAAIRQQDDIRDACHTFSKVISDQAAETDQTWPFVALQNFESLGEDFHKIAGTEIFTLFPTVTREKTEDWLNYTDKEHAPMVRHSHMLKYKNMDNLNEVGYKSYIQSASPTGMIPDIDRDVYHPMWQFSPPMFTYGAINWNILSLPDLASVFDAVKVLKNESLVSPVRPYATASMAFTDEEHARMHSEIEGSSTEFPHSFMYTPVHLDSQDSNSPIVAIFGAAMAWDFSLRSLLPAGVIGIHAVLKNSCNQSFTYEINGPDAFYVGEGDLHEDEFQSLKRVVSLSLHSHPDTESTEGHCLYSMHLYPDSKFASLYLTAAPLLFAIGVAGAFGFMVIVFFVYNRFVFTRNEKLVENAARSNAVITSLFPEAIRNQLIGDNNNTNNPRSFQELLGPVSDPVANLARPPLADYFATATVMFADICGFTAWSSVREPSQVFTLLETLYGSFDRLTKNSKVFKVETVGDSYIAATGIPKYHRDHAVSMVQFAHRISKEMSAMTKMLETTLGPDTSDLLLRIGIHTGPVTAGVIRGDKARFQLFGDTMNVASRVESTGVAGRIHVSKDTADSLRKCNKGHWLVKRENGSVVAKGKGDIQTYWIGKAVEKAKPESYGPYETASESDSSQNPDDVVDGQFSEQLGHSEGREDRLVDWNATVFLDILKHIVARREAYAKAGINSNSEPRSDDPEVLTRMNMNDYKPINGVREIIALPDFNDVAEAMKEDVQSVEIPDEVVAELRSYISTVAGLYRSNPFHNFEHASHVTMSVIKLLSRIKAPSDLELMERHGSSEDLSQDIHAHLHDHTYGITSDPLTQFACAFAALVHDVDHEGVPNAQLVQEGAAVATMYNERSVAEQNSLVIAWNLLMSDRFANLRNTICATATELSRFRQLATNAVMATDIVDKDLKQLRNNRWDKAFKRDNNAVILQSYEEEEDETRDSINRKATIVIEHLIQASDVSHTMQHWHVYRKWNENLFRESYAAYIAGRAATDPSINWYKGEIGFFDFYIIPLAKKLESCGVFGKSSDEFLNYARSNREEWESRGESIVAELVANVKKEFKENA
ncbi:unnamed protein product [Cylindrotheca closterium]|uniref:Phosphodiesterase n=1 Tax=Cylindrotheca closterium TaxID=2856 RepID=A0AAD2CNF8_9STRA|nr:unnamed protein product [Cylindrotheca closterium]